MNIKYATISKTGRRSNNEDCFNVLEMPEHNRFMGIVCDGMGGHSFGEVASEAVCNAISRYLGKRQTPQTVRQKSLWHARRPVTRMPSSHRSCSPLHSLFGAEHTGQNMA